ncbi:MAG: rhodanese-like domain-containing protein [Lamprocystis purpurea]|jgi:rhodanese-related sulfurtransferase|uniref:rhodanese-like domain-containing protein n=1 Tax=Lamprocystis purpurea TaxID=61598 RepID=UPI000367244E|nr:rhodanese-like domain-containing protein [Lamprocystis purpurea]MBV5275094.1 rhodanese-like domain-containing protein [Lamprocystis purpurea]
MILRFPLKRQALALFTGLLLTACLSEAGPTLTAPEANDQARTGALTLIDIRTPEEWRQTGVAEGAVRIEMRNPKGPDGFAEAVLAEVKGDRNAPIALICRTGNRTTYMQKELEARGFTHVYNIKEGMVGSAAGPGWIKRGLPVQACKQC